MKPIINGTTFGLITIEGTTYEYDVVIHLNGEVEKRKKKLSKAVFGTSHTVSKDEAKFVYENGAESIIIGSGQNGVLRLSREAEDYFKKKGCTVIVETTPEAIVKWNNTDKNTVGMFHVTC